MRWLLTGLVMRRYFSFVSISMGPTSLLIVSSFIPSKAEYQVEAPSQTVPAELAACRR